jgi:DDE superfamily endonuclease
MLVLVYLRKGEPFAQVGAGFDVSTATCWRYVNETVELLARRAPKLRAALRKAKRQGHAYVIIDGTLIPIDRIAVDRPFYSGKHKRHGVNLQVIASPDGEILWVSGQLPGSTHDTAAARIWSILAALEEAGLIALGDKGYHGYDETRQHVITPYKGRKKPQSQKDANRTHAGCAVPANAPTPNSSTGVSCTNSAAAHTALADSPKPSTCCRTTKSLPDEKGSTKNK